MQPGMGGMQQGGMQMQQQPMDPYGGGGGQQGGGQQGGGQQGGGQQGPVQFANEAQQAAMKFQAAKSFPMMAEESHMGHQPNVQYFDGPDCGPHPLDPTPGLSRTIVKLPHPRYEGGPQFIDGVAKANTTFAWTELCGTREPECSLAPSPQVPMKSWYNSYLYVPEQRSHVERQYLERFVPGPDGEWIDVVKARRMSGFLAEQSLKAAQANEEQRLVRNGDAIEMTDYVDQYSGEHLVACNNRLMSKAEVYQRYNIHKSDWAQQVDALPQFDYDNLRIPWIFGKVDRNKKVSQGAYDWFDRRNPRVVSDRSYKLMELPSYYVDEDMYNKWRPHGNPGVVGLGQDVATRARYLDDYPYQL